MNTPVQPQIRHATEQDLPAILSLLDRAFAPSTYESHLMKGLVQNKREIHHWVVCIEGRILGHVCYSNAYCGQQVIGMHLGPVAIDPDFQRQGLGSKIIRDTLHTPVLASRSIFVLGDPAFYGRFGFRRIAQPICPFDETNTHFSALNYTDPKPFRIGYEPEFGE